MKSKQADHTTCYSFPRGIASFVRVRFVSWCNKVTEVFGIEVNFHNIFPIVIIGAIRTKGFMARNGLELHVRPGILVRVIESPVTPRSRAIPGVVSSVWSTMMVGTR